MPLYTYKARNRRGEALQGETEADSTKAVADQLINSELTPITIEEARAGESAFGSLSGLLKSRRVSTDELIIFTRQLYSLMRAGVPIIRTLHSLSQSARSAQLRDVLQSVTADLESGQQLSTAFARQNQVFPSLFVNIVRVGENSGRLDESLLQLAEHLEREKNNRNQLKAALRYPAIVLIAMIAALVIINIFVIPAFAGVFEGFGAELPLATRILLTISNFTVAYWPQLLAACVVGFFATRVWINTSAGRYLWDRWKLKIPLFGSLILRGTLGRFARSLGLASQSGVPLLQGLTVVSGTVDNAFLEERILTMRSGIEHGESLTRTAASAGMFTPLVLQMIAVGEETGAVDQQLLETAEHYEREVEYELKTIGDTLEPVIIVALGAMVLVLALGIFLPMWDLSAAAG